MADSVRLFKALADETRLRILHLLSRRELCVCQIVGVLKIGQSKASRHLAHLKNAGLVTDRREGLWIHYSLAQPDGRLHRRVVDWLKQATQELPSAARDLEALRRVGECGDLCPDHASSRADGRHDAAAAGCP
jgi:ArsR family transcriptional regulator